MELATEDILAAYANPKRIDGGSQKEVYTVDDPAYGRCVLKIGRGESAQSMQRIEREVATLQSIQSEFFPRSYGITQHAEGRFAILEEWIDGGKLTDQLDQFSTPPLASNIIAQIVTGLRLLWDRRIVHRDIKPDNLLITKKGEVRIIDLGIARLLDEATLTHDFAMMGPCTPVYASPEQLANRKPLIDHRADQFSIGIVYSQLLLSGLHPFDPAVVESGNNIVENIVKNNWAKEKVHDLCGDSIFAIITKLLGKEPYNRFRVTAQLEQMLYEVS